MEHIVQFAIGIDDEAIRKRVEQNAEKQIVGNIEKDLREKIFHYNSWNRSDPESLSEDAYGIIRSIMESYKDDIIRLAVDRLVDSMRRTKAVKEAVGEVVRGVK